MSEALEALGSSAAPSLLAQLFEIFWIMLYTVIPIGIIGVVIAHLIYSRKDREINEKRKNQADQS
jgi:mannose/fructose/N-acetylgalactosamine-specific phosphotransferase system component IIC